jgi:hypothetical protein
MTTYSIRSTAERDQYGRNTGRRVYHVVEERNPHVQQHYGSYRTRAQARKALRQIAWGETPDAGDYGHN